MEIENELQTDLNTISLEDYQCLDECFQFFPKKKKSKKIENFWKKKIVAINQKKIEPISEILSKGLISKTNFYNIAFQSIDDHFLKGSLVLPEQEKISPTIVHIHDYGLHQVQAPSYSLKKMGLAQLFLSLRNHENFAVIPKNLDLLIKNFENLEDYFLTQIYSDAICALNFVSSFKELDEENIILQGKGISSSICIFAASSSKKVKGLILDEVSISSICDETINLEDNWMFEFKKSIEDNQLHIQEILPNLSHFDVLNFVEKINIPVLLFLKFEKENLQKTKQAFAFFNYLNCDKRVKIFLNDSSENIEEKEKIRNNFIKEVFQL